MDAILRSHLIKCFDAFAATCPSRHATIAAKAAGDWRFFDRLNDVQKTFTIRKYEEVLRWFDANWPPDQEWPVDVPRLKAATEADAKSL